MMYADCMKTVMGGLSVLLVLTACSSGPKKTSTAPPPSQPAVRAQEPIADRPVAADPKMAAPSDRALSDRVDVATGMVSECSSRMDANGNIVYDDPSCPTRNRRTGGVEAAQDPAAVNQPMDAAVSNVLKAEAAGDQGNIPEMLRYTRLSLDQAQQVQRARTDAYLNAGIIDLKDTLIIGSRDRIAPSALRDARAKLSRAAYTTRTSAVSTANPSTHTIKGELARNTKPTEGGVSGGEHYVVRDRENREMPISLSPEMSRQVQVGDVVEAQVDSKGQVTSITKAE